MVPRASWHRGCPARARACDRTGRNLRHWKEATMFPLLLWFLGVPGLVVILLLLLGVIHI